MDPEKLDSRLNSLRKPPTTNPQHQEREMEEGMGEVERGGNRGVRSNPVEEPPPSTGHGGLRLIHNVCLG